MSAYGLGTRALDWQAAVAPLRIEFTKTETAAEGMTLHGTPALAPPLPVPSPVPASTAAPGTRLKLLSVWLQEPMVPVLWLILGWMNAHSRVLAYAQFKAGKTTLILNLLRSLADGALFLGEATVTALTTGQTVVVLDFEMSENQLREWAAKQQIANTDRVVIKPLRGTARSFNILDSKCRSDWATALRTVNCKFLIVDCIGPVMSALDLDESNNTQVAKFLRLVDELLVEAGVPNCWLVHHMGHDEKRPRGASAVLGWCDVSITLSRSGDVSTGQRYISAVGRDVSQTKRALTYDDATHHFTLAPPTQFSVQVGSMAGGPKKAVDRALQEIVALLQPPRAPLGVRDITQHLAAAGQVFHENTVRSSVNAGVQGGELKGLGPNNKRTYTVP